MRDTWGKQSNPGKVGILDPFQLRRKALRRKAKRVPKGANQVNRLPVTAHYVVILTYEVESYGVWAEKLMVAASYRWATLVKIVYLV